MMGEREKNMKDARGFARIVSMMTGVLVVAAILPCTAWAQGDQSPWMIRARLLSVVPDDDSSTITVIGGKAEVDDAITADVDFSYFFCDNIAAELTLTVSPHDVEAKNTSAGKIDLGDVKLLPPTLTLQYHFLPDEKIRPYVGAGVNYTIFFDEDHGPTAVGIDYDDAFGFALQAGVDIGLDEHWALNFDVKKVWLETDVSVDALGTTVKTDVDIDPWLFGVGLGYRF
jgi:outer membrane protein